MNIFRIVYDLIPSTNGLLPISNGHVLYAAILKKISDFDSDLAEYLHGSKQISPIAITPLRPLNSKADVSQGLMRIKGENTYRFSISVLTNQIKNILDAIMNIENIIFKLGIIEFKAIALNFEKLSYRDIFDRNNKNVSLLRIRFLTPTQLSTQRSNYPVVLPLPELIFSNLCRIWTTFSNIEIDCYAFYDWIVKNVYIREHKLRSREVDIGKKAKQVGFKGYVAFRIADDKFSNWMNILAKFGEYSNVGVKRSFGMGVIRVLE